MPPLSEGMGKGRRTCVIVSKINRAFTMPCSPESPVLLVVPAEMSALPVQRASPSRMVEGGQLASAAKYIRERINGRSPVCKEFGLRALKEPPDKMAETEAESRRQTLNVVSKSIEVSMEHLPRAHPEGVIELVPSCSQHNAALTLSIANILEDGRAKRFSRAVEGSELPCERPGHCLECSLECSDTSRGLTVGRARVPLLLGEVGEKWPACIVVNKVKNVILTPCSPEALMVVTPPIPEENRKLIRRVPEVIEQPIMVGQRAVSIVVGDRKLGVGARSQLSELAHMPPNTPIPSPVAFPRLDVIALSTLVVAPGAAHNIVG